MRDTAQYPLTPITLDAMDEYTPMWFSGDFRNAVFTLIASGSADCTIKFYESNQEARPDLSQAASSSNQYSTVQVIDLESGAPIEGDTGVVYAGSSDGQHMYEMNTNANRWVGIKMTARSAGEVSPSVFLTNNA